MNNDKITPFSLNNVVNSMTLELQELMEIYPEQIWIELSPQAQQKAWLQTASEFYSNAPARWTAFMNCLCLDMLVSWFKEDSAFQETLGVWPKTADLPSIWEVVNGTALTLNGTRLVLIPSEKSNVQEFRIPREWVDIPNWAGNYYLAIQLNPAENWLRVWGYASHQQIREKAKYDPIDQTYSLNKENFIGDFNVLWVVRSLYPHKTPKVKPLPSLSKKQVDQLLEQLGQWTPTSPRLNVTFQLWAALLASDESRQHLYRQRLLNVQRDGVESSKRRVHNLSKWFQNIFDSGWQSLDTLLTPEQMSLAVHFRSHNSLNEVSVKGAKLIDLGMKLGGQAVALLVGLSPEVDEKVSLRVQLHPANGEIYLPLNLRLALLSQPGEILQEVRSGSYDNYIQLKRFKSSLGKRFSIQIALGDVSIKEDFVLEKLVS